MYLFGFAWNGYGFVYVSRMGLHGFVLILMYFVLIRADFV